MARVETVQHSGAQKLRPRLKLVKLALIVRTCNIGGSSYHKLTSREVNYGSRGRSMPVADTILSEAPPQGYRGTLNPDQLYTKLTTLSPTRHPESRFALMYIATLSYTGRTVMYLITNGMLRRLRRGPDAPAMWQDEDWRITIRGSAATWRIFHRLLCPLSLIVSGVDAHLQV